MAQAQGTRPKANTSGREIRCLLLRALSLKPIIFIPYDNQADTDYFLEVQWVKQ